MLTFLSLLCRAPSHTLSFLVMLMHQCGLRGAVGVRIRAEKAIWKENERLASVSLRCSWWHGELGRTMLPKRSTFALFKTIVSIQSIVKSCRFCSCLDVGQSSQKAVGWAKISRKCGKVDWDVGVIMRQQRVLVFSEPWSGPNLFFPSPAFN
ncbi:hypothetical protein K458DRAFT_137461 [Lentithecium fluviatile CBS 122367]|uniref:Secreted protein n=1 Tax=Lentithecium fluviatile CBS 122367 TaxID=1168545 RepID=A0A6G1IK40_9PLEO|nr:hypothetical protein K458DRAFT_137461 [Lentithecium fluviatile CBS 122367]